MTRTESSSQQIDSKNQLVQQQQQQSAPHNQQVSNMSVEPIDFDDCLKDSPKFRQNLKDNLNYVENLENCMSKTIKHINNYIESGREHIQAQQDFIDSMKLLNNALGSSGNNSNSNNNNDLSKNVNTLLGTLAEIMRLHEIVIDQSARTVGTSLNKFINDDILKIKEARKSFDKISHEYDQAVTRHSQPVKKQQDDSENLLIATSTAFTHTSLDLSIQLTALQSKKGYDILSSLLSFTKAHSTFFHQGSDLFEDLKPHISDMDEYLSNIHDEFETLTRSLPSKHLMVSNNELRPLCFDNKAALVHLEGYLFKRASNGFKVWNRRWFILKDHQLLYQKRGETQPTIMEEDLRLLTVRPVERIDGDRRFCFEVLSPQKSHILQADTEAACQTWITAIQAGINAAFHDTEHKTSLSKSTSANSELASGGSSSWGSGFSLKALQQQATNKLNSLTTLQQQQQQQSDSRDSGGHQKTASKSNIDDKQQSNHKQLQQRSSNNESDDDGGSESDQDFKVDEQGRSYVPLRDNDDLDVNEDDVDGNRGDAAKGNKDAANYPVAADSAATASQTEPPMKPQRAYMKILALPGNDACADCGAPQPQWASINLGITLCIECAGIHRSLGVHLSKVRSLTLDIEVWTQEIVQLMLSLGNTNVNSAKMACYRGQMAPIDAQSCREDREKWIKAKYLLKTFMRPPGDDGKTLDESLADDD